MDPLAAFLEDEHKLMLSSVFKSTTVHTAPTPISTPNLGHSAAGQSFDAFPASPDQTDFADLVARQQAERDVAWSTATRFLSFPKPEDHVEIIGLAFGERPNRTSKITKSIQLLLLENDPSRWSNGGSLTEWYTYEVQSHFRKHFHARLAALWEHKIECEDAWNVLESTVTKLNWLFRNYMRPALEHILPLCSEHSLVGETGNPGSGARRNASALSSKFKRVVQSALIQSIPSERFFATLAYILLDGGRQVFALDSPGHTSQDAQSDIKGVRARLTDLLQLLQETGLGGSLAQRAFSQAMEKLMSEFIISRYVKVDWFGRSSVIKRLYDWIQVGFAPFVRDVLRWLTDNDDEELSLSANEVQQWQDMAVIRLGRSRVENLFDYVVNWDKSLGAILDLKEYITTPSARNYLTTSFCKQLTRRLLHSGATTTQILDGYIFVIRAFNELDPKGVLLDRVAKPIRRYLRDRDDTARVIIISLLADIPSDSESRIDMHGDVSVEIAAEMMNPTPSGSHEPNQALDWNNMAWTPDPADAGPGFKKSASEDIISDLLSLYDREDFIAELKNILGEQLLKSDDSNLEKEIRLLELFKVRLGEDKLQACEVMLRDVLESKRINASVKSTAQESGESDLTARILSRFFWPPLREETFLVPAEVHDMQAQYARGFEKVKDMRKLEWLPSLGRVSVELQLEDRSLELDVQPWQASVIRAFHSEHNSVQQAPTRTVDDLETHLEMEEGMVRNALSFWVGKRVLVETSTDAFTVLERLDGEGAEPSHEAAAAYAAEEANADTMSAVKSQEDMLLANLDLYRQFITGMLMNQGSMSTSKILMMLRMVVPGGFPFGQEEVRTILGKMVDGGNLVGTGDVFSVRKE